MMKINLENQFDYIFKPLDYKGKNEIPIEDYMVLKYLSKYSIYCIELKTIENYIIIDEEQQKYFKSIKDIIQMTTEMNLDELSGLENIVKHNNEIYKIFKNYQPKDLKEINIDLKKYVNDKILILNKINEIQSTEMIEVFTKISMILEVISYNKQMIKNYEIKDEQTKKIMNEFNNNLQKLENNIDEEMSAKVFKNIDKYSILEIKSISLLKDIFENLKEKVLKLNNEDFKEEIKVSKIGIKKYL